MVLDLKKNKPQTLELIFSWQISTAEGFFFKGGDIRRPPNATALSYAFKIYILKRLIIN